MLGGSGALLRLFARWYTLALIFIIALTAFAPTLFLGDESLLLLAGHALPDGRDADTPMRQLVLHMGMLVPLMIAFCTNVATGELYGTSVSWSLPHLGRRMLAGHAVVLTLVTIAIGVFALLRTETTTAVYAIAMVPFWYGLGASGSVFAPLRWMVGGLALVTIVLALRPTWYAAALAPSMMAHMLVGAAMVTGILMLVYRHRATGIRTSVLLHPTRMLQAEAASSTTTSGAIALPREHSPRDGMRSWIQAAMHESSRSGRQWIRSYTLFFAFMATFIYLTGSMLGVIAMTVVGSGLQLSRVFAYPLSRTEQAMLRYACAAVELVLIGVVVGLTYALLEGLGVPRTLLTDPVTRFDWRVELAALCVLIPIAQWPRAVKQAPYQTWRIALIVPAMLLMFGTVFLPRVLMRAVGDNTTAALAWLGVALVVVQGTYYMALRAAYARRDL
jgi:hypothetical protein